MTKLFGHRADAQQVDVGEVEVGFGIEILIAQVAPADDGHAVVHQEQLVVHAPMLTRQVEEAANRTRHAGAAAQVQRVEHTYLNVRVGIESAHDDVQAVAGGVVEQNAHAHATVGGAQQFMHQGAGAEAIVDDVVLQIDARLGVADQFGAGAERLVAVGQQAKARAATIGRGLAQYRAAEGRVFGG